MAPPHGMTAALIALGSNLGDRAATLRAAIDALACLPQTALVGVSTFRETFPIGGPPGQPRFLNAAALLETGLEPAGLLDAILGIERDLGRTRGQPWAARTVDLDLLLHGAAVQKTARLTLPHPRMAWRRFVLEGAAEAAPELVHPTIGWTLARLLNHLGSTPPYLAITGRPVAACTELARRVGQRLGGEMLLDPGSPLQDAAVRLADRWTMAAATLDGRASLLSAITFPMAAMGRWFVSDFWLDAARLDVAAWPGEAEQAALGRYLEGHRRHAPRPRLVVVLDAEETEAAREAFRHYCCQVGAGPVLPWSNVDLDAAADEVSAAVQAMCMPPGRPWLEGSTSPPS